MECEISQAGRSLLASGTPYLRRTDFLESLPAEGQSFTITHNEKSLGYAYTGYSQKSDVCIISEPLSQSFFEKTIQIALEKRKKLFPKLPEAFRLIHSEADLIPGIHIEIFKEFVVITYFNRGIEKHQDELLAALKKTFPRAKGMYAKDRTPTAKDSETQLIWGEAAPESLIIQENGAKFIVKLNTGLMTGLFLDQRANRAWLKTISKNKTVCNTFSYTASLSIACALGEAKETTIVDISKTYNAWAQENFLLNELSLEKNQIITADTLEHFQFCQRKNIRYDIIILDPPTFAKKKTGTFSVQKNYQELIKHSLPLLNPRGILVCSTNYSQWEEKDFLKVIDAEFRAFKKSYKILHKAHADKDFPVMASYPESNHLKFISLQI